MIFVLSFEENTEELGIVSIIEFLIYSILIEKIVLFFFNQELLKLRKQNSKVIFSLGFVS